MAGDSSLYLGFDLSTQQLKGIVVNSDLHVQHEAMFDFDKDSHGFDVCKGVLTNDPENEVYAPVALWLQALDTLMQSLKTDGLDFSKIKGISGAGQQHGSVFWSAQGVEALGRLDKGKGLEEQLKDAFAYPYSPNWQDTSTQAECDEFDKVLGGAQALANATGSKAHTRFTGPQILRFRQKHPDAYKNTTRISLVSSFLASLVLGKIAPIDISDVCGMNLWDIKHGQWDDSLLSLSAGADQKASLLEKLGSVPASGGDSFGPISSYFVERYGFDPSCQIIPFTGDNPATILSLPLRPLDAIVSLGTSTTFLMSTPHYKPDPAVHFMNHPTTPGLYMFMLCYKNGGLAREKLRDAINRDNSGTWDNFNKSVMTTPRLGIYHPSDTMKLGLFFPRPEIVPPLPAGTYRFEYDPRTETLKKTSGEWWTQHDSRAIVEGQFLSLRLRSQALVQGSGPADGTPPQPRRIYLVGGAARNPAIAHVAGEVLGGAEGVYRLDVGENACALGAAYKAVWGVERTGDESFEDLIGKRWREEDFAIKIEEGYQGGYWERYGIALEGFEKMEQLLLKEHEPK